MKAWTGKSLPELAPWEAPTCRAILNRVNPIIEIVNNYERAINSLPPDILVHWTHIKFNDKTCNCKKEITEQFRTRK